MTAETTVAVHPHKLAVLATALRRLDDALFTHATTSFLALLEGMEDTTVIAPLLEAADWATDRSLELQALLDEVVSWYVGGERTPLVDVDVWRAPYDAAFDDPRAAVADAERARVLVGALVASAGLSQGSEGSEPDDIADLTDLLHRWRHDPVFAAALAGGLPVADVVHLVLLEQQWRAHGSDPGEARLAQARHQVFATLATASSMGVLGFGFVDLVRELHPGGAAPGSSGPGEQDLVSLLPLGLLFVPGSVWGTDFLIDAVEELVIPLNRAGGDREVARRVGGEDPRVHILGALARHPAAAERIVATVDLDTLVDARFAYGDDGRAVADVLAAATRPAGGERAAANMVRFADWVVRRRPDLPPLTRRQLGALTAPWIACFRSEARDDDPSLANPMRALTDDSRLAYLRVVTEDLDAAVDLRRGELGWANGRFGSLAGAGFDGTGLGLVFDVDGRVSKAVYAGVLDQMRSQDERVAFDVKVASFLVGLSTLGMSHALDTIIPVGFDLVSAPVLPPATMALDFATRFPSLIDSDVRKLETSLLAALWARRSENHVFDGVAPPPPSLVFGEPSRLLLEPEMTGTQHDAWTRWVDENQLRDRAHFEQVTARVDG